MKSMSGTLPIMSATGGLYLGPNAVSLAFAVA